jgi:hypothetical protein
MGRRLKKLLQAPRNPEASGTRRSSTGVDYVVVSGAGTLFKDVPLHSIRASSGARIDEVVKASSARREAVGLPAVAPR